MTMNSAAGIPLPDTSDFGEAFAIVFRDREVFQNSFADDHEQRGGNPFAGHVRDGYSNMRFVEEVEVIEIAADFLSRRCCR